MRIKIISGQVFVLLLVFFAFFIIVASAQVRNEKVDILNDLSPKNWFAIQNRVLEVQGGGYYESLKLLSQNPVGNERFGGDIDVSGTNFVIGAIAPFAGTGAAYIYERNPVNGNQWDFITQINANDGANNDRFGRSVSIDGDTIVVGAYQNSDFGANSGAAYIFERNQGGPSNWGQVKKLLPLDGAAGDRFGWDVSISGDFVAIGAYWDDDACPGNPSCDSGSVYIFERNAGGTNNWGQVNKITASDASGGDYFGRAIRLDNDTLVIGSQACGQCDNTVFTGKVYVFDYDQSGNIWNQTKIILASDAMNGDNFGIDVSVYGDLIVVGASDDDNNNGSGAGSAYIYERDLGGTNNWGEVTKLLASDGMSFDEYGWNVDVFEDMVTVGALLGDGNTNDSGSAYIYEQNQGGTDNWGEIMELIPSEGATDDRYGTVAVIRGLVITGAPLFDDITGDDQGAVFLFAHDYPPVANDDSGSFFTTDEDSSFTTGNVLDNDNDPVGLPISVANFDVSNMIGLLTFNGDGTFDYDPNGQFEYLAIGEQSLETFTYTISNTIGLTDTATVTITVLGVNDAPLINSLNASPNPLNEGETTTLNGDFFDPESNDPHKVTISWGDGLTNTLFLPAGTFVFSYTHSYLDDVPSGTPTDIYAVLVAVSDGQLNDTASINLTVNNLPPSLSNLGAIEVDENSSTTLTGNLFDPSPTDSFTLTVEWGDGSISNYLYPAGTTVFTETHQYLDDDPSGTPFDIVAVSVTLSDDDSGQASETTEVRVNNLAPIVNARSDLNINFGQAVNFSGIFTDTGTLDTHTILWDFGDGTTITGTLTPTHIFLQSGVYTVTLTITDDDGGVGEDFLVIELSQHTIYLPVSVNTCDYLINCVP